MKDMIERYIYAVTRRLPAKIQDEVKQELRANIYDMLQENPSDQEIEKVLIELGNPRDMANKYQSEERYLISPRYFPDYFYTLKIVVIILILVGFFSGLIDLLIRYGSSGFWEVFSRVFGLIFESIYEGALSAFTIVTIIFVIIEFIQRKENKEWKIKDLPELPKENRIKISRTSTVISMILFASFASLFVLALAKYDKSLGIYVDGEFIAPFFNSDAIKVFVPIFIVLFAFGLAVHLFKLVDGQWSNRVTILYTAKEILGLILFAVFISHPELIHPDFYNAFSTIFSVSINEAINGFNIARNALIALIATLVALDLVLLWIKVIRFQRKQKQKLILK